MSGVTGTHALSQEEIVKAFVAGAVVRREIEQVATELLDTHSQSMTDLIWLRDRCGGHLPMLRDALVEVLAEVKAGGDPIKELREAADRMEDES